MRFLLVTGLSGSGKKTAMRYLEDMGALCVDNLLPMMIRDFMKACQKTALHNKICAVAVDVRSGEFFDADEVAKLIAEMREKGYQIETLYMEAGTDMLVSRYKESRRPHPLAEKGGSVEQAIRREMDLLAPVREQADFVVNTSRLTLGQLQSRLFELLCGEGEKRELDLTVLSFGYKHGLPAEADLVFDARFLPNPFYVDELREKTGLDLPVKEYVFSFQQTRTFMEQLETMLEFLIPLYIEEGKKSLTVAVGCTGGRHRSVAIAAALNDHFLARGMASVNVNRDLDK